MATSGTTAFNLDVQDIAEEAFERAGVPFRTGYDLRTARRSLDLVTRELSNQGILSWTVDEEELSLVSGTATYSLATDTLDVLDGVYRTSDGTSSQFDQAMERLPIGRYANLSLKNQTGIPTKYYIDRGLKQVTLWPVPNDSTSKFTYWRLRTIEDAGAGGSNNLDLPTRLLPTITAALAYQIALKRSPDRVQMCFNEYQRQLQLALDEDADRSSFYIRPSDAYRI